MRAPDSGLGYRPDIDGLRGVAIALVLGYHVAPETLSGGFVGVDVFFVISGFLITRILISEPGSFGRFYARRVRRLAPALLVVLVTTLALGKATLLGGAFQELTKHAAASAVFVANIVFWLESGYFDAAAIEKPLLHLWSLGIEEQFYLFWPVTLWWLLRKGRASIWGTALLAAGSFVGCALVVSSTPDAAFYLPWYRMWEPLLGALIALGGCPRWQQRGGSCGAGWLAWSGLLLVLGSAVFLGRGTPFPSWSALAPVAGTAMLIVAGDGSRIGRALLSSKSAVGLGRISYPLYLWHWPLISLLGDSRPAAGVASRGLLCLLAVGLSIGTYRLIEIPSRRMYRLRPEATVGLLSAAMILVTCAAVWLHRGDRTAAVARLPELELLERARFIDAELRAGLGEASCEGLEGLPAGHEVKCRLSDPENTSEPVVLWGDSTAESWAPLVFAVGEDRGRDVVVLSSSGCPPVLGVRSPLHPDCDLQDASWKLDVIERLQPAHLILSARWGAYLNDTPRESRVDLHYVTLQPDGPATQRSSRRAMTRRLPETIKRLREIAPVTVIASVPDLLNNLPRAFLLGLDYGPSLVMHSEFQRQVTDLLAEVATRNPGVTVLDPAEMLCASGTCVGIVGDTVVYQDDNHVTAQGALLFRHLLGRALDAAEAAPLPASSSVSRGGRSTATSSRTDDSLD